MVRAVEPPVHAAGEGVRGRTGVSAMDLSPISARDAVGRLTGIESGLLLPPPIARRAMHRIVRAIARLTTTTGWKREESPHGTR